MNRKGPRTIVSWKQVGDSKAVISLVSVCQNPKCLARQVTRCPRPISPDVTPADATAISPECKFPARCASTLRARSKQRSIGARIVVNSSNLTTSAALSSYCRYNLSARCRCEVNSRKARNTSWSTKSRPCKLLDRSNESNASGAKA